MKNWKNILINYFKLIFSIFLIFIYSNNLKANDLILEIQGNNYTDEDVILALIKNKPKEISEDYSNYLIKILNNSLLFESVSVKIKENKYIIDITEFPNINKIYFDNNERLKDEDLLNIVNELNLTNLNPTFINAFIEELTKNGVMEESRLYQAPFTDLASSGPEKLFEENKIDILFDKINEIKKRAIA